MLGIVAALLLGACERPKEQEAKYTEHGKALYEQGDLVKATLEFKTNAVIGAIADFAPMLVGRDPRNIEHCFQIMSKHSFWRMGVIGTSAISGIEMAPCPSTTTSPVSVGSLKTVTLILSPLSRR